MNFCIKHVGIYRYEYFLNKAYHWKQELSSESNTGRFIQNSILHLKLNNDKNQYLFTKTIPDLGVFDDHEPTGKNTRNIKT